MTNTSNWPLSPTGRIVLPIDHRHTSVLLERQSRERPDHPFFTIEGRTVSFREAHERVLRVAAGLKRVGVQEGARVGVMLPNVAAFVLVWLAAAHLGATLVAINPQFRGRLLDTALGDVGCSVLVLHAASADALDSVAPAVRERIGVVIGADDVASALPGAVSLASWDDGSAVSPTPAGGDLRSIHVISFTSGSTGPAKGVMLTTNQALDAACTYVHAVRLTSDDTLYTPFAFFHGMSTRLGVVPALIVGSHVVIAERFSASRYWQEATACGATVGQTLPPMTALLKALPPGPFDRAHRVTRMYNSRADEDFERRFGVRLAEAYGMTEIGLVIYSGYPERRAGAAGRLHPEWEMAIVDEHDLPVPAGEPGELVFRPKSPWLITPGYVGRPDATVEATRNLWFHSGDIGRQDADGYVYFIDRRKERIRRLGENISSFDVESLVSAHPDVRECAALAYPAAMGEDDLRIVIVRAEGVELPPRALYDWLVGVMPKYMLPRYIEFAAALPRTPTNKIEKFRLKDAGLADDAWDSQLHVAAARSNEGGGVTKNIAMSTMADVAFAARDALGEGPAWDARTGQLYWIDLLEKRLARGDAATGVVESRTLPFAASRVTLCDDDRLLVSFLRRPALGSFEAESFETLDLGDAVIDKQRFNDGACDSRGRLWTCTYDGRLTESNGRMLCIAGGRARRVADGVRMPNGIRFGPDEKTMYFIDSYPGHVWAYPFDIDADGAELGARRLLIDFEGSGAKPDGCAMDADGCLWIAEVNHRRVARYTPAGALDAVIEVPTSKPTSVTFGGSDLRTLYITSRIDGLGDEQRAREPHAGSVFAARASTPGLPEHRYRTT